MYRLQSNHWPSDCTHNWEALANMPVSNQIALIVMQLPAVMSAQVFISLHGNQVVLKLPDRNTEHFWGRTNHGIYQSLAG